MAVPTVVLDNPATSLREAWQDEAGTGEYRLAYSLSKTDVEAGHARIPSSVQAWGTYPATSGLVKGVPA